ncbi:CusA/CzcA family heavy metal efflux RND transporter [Sphingomonas koreensis]|jgi:cobalt-zinc-cadmium resistance protein CzcA|uniref:Cation transporter n=2 Tax=Pseudomonadota TaxID=1224 RepID=A0A1L6JFF6_9SPHN|nr:MULTISPECIES: CusA/CzcA family heavy metal efflux RND transporter [Sphingomonas]APR54618.1 cation transporter [Sphingomonas koreensis]MBA4760918.1 CusA/CzcA family heavy metal efflux RND transporter [Sphingomonas sp.]MDC7810844.1 CusA/CzcA family heavy metal efflux RND transporter [Sphingomonas koreensis]MDK2769272.1 CusA/CzcA family heavy metal efflux RND transporter [Sphingomonas sp.]PJI89717.1 cobalt-zinc-cadmium resistance protein CzcA [Sphingomonas koreensis]
MIERIVTFAVERRWFVLLMTLIATVIGAVSLSRLPIDAVPDITNNQVQINIRAPALSPELVEKQVAFPIETALAGVPGLEHTRSLSRNGFAQVTAVFTDSTNIYFARQQVAERLRTAEESLPAGATPEMGPIATGLGEVYMWTVHMAHRPEDKHKPGEPGIQPDGSYLTPEGERLVSEADKATYLRTTQDWIVAPLLKSVPGLAGVDSIGGYVKQFQVVPDVQRLTALKLSLGDLATALEENNSAVGAGTVDRNGEGLAVRSDARIANADQLGRTVIATREGVPILLNQVATVRTGQAIRMGSASENAQEVVVGTAIMRIGENSRNVASAVATRLDEVNASLPTDIVIQPVLDRTGLVNSTIKTVAKNLSEGALLVIVVLFLLLGNFRAALIAALVIPVTMLMTSFGMLRGGVSANLMSLGALDFGLIVDGAVIIVENALRRIAERQHHIGRTLDKGERLSVVAGAAREMIRPSVYGQAIIILVYVPLLTLTGVEGKTFTPMALTVILALAFAFVLSLTFVPAMLAIWLSKPVEEKEGRIMSWLKRRYEPGLDRAMARPRVTILAGVGAFLLAILAFMTLGQEFLPQLDEGDATVQVLRVPGTSVEQSQAMQFQVEKAISSIPEVKFVFSKTGTAELASDPMPPNISDTFVIMKKHADWPDPSLTKAEVVAKIEKALEGLPGNAFEISQPIQMRFNELIAGVRGDIAVKVFGDDTDAMNDTANKIAGILRGVDGATDVRVEQTEGLPMLDIRPNRDAMARLGITARVMQDTVAAAIGGRDAGMIFEGDRRFAVTIRLTDAARADLQTLGQVPVPTPDGAFVPLESVADIAVTSGPNQISRENGKRRVVVQANVRGRDVAGVVEDARAAIARDVRLPAGQYLEWGGQFENLQSASARLMLVVPACFALIILLLYGALGSVRDAAIVFTGVPLALVGGVLALFLRGMPFSISAAVGFIALSGIAVLNGLVMVTSIQDLMARGVSRAEAAYQGALARLRPVVMTALVASLGFVPMAIATGSGAEVQKPLATVVIGGLISATLLTLFVLPTLYARYGRRETDVSEVETPSSQGGTPLPAH